MSDSSHDDETAEPRKRRRQPIEIHRDAEGRIVGTRAIVIVPVPPRGRRFERQDPADTEKPPPPPLHSPEDRKEEAVGLANAIALDVRTALLVPLSHPRPATLLGAGKVEEIKALVERKLAALVVVDHPLTPIQQRNLEKAWETKVLDRTGLILEIFGRRAQTKEGRLQVELAHLTYQKSRLVRSWTHLERQRGGAGFLGGPGERQLELDRRMIEGKIETLKRDLAEVIRTRTLNRSGRRKVPFRIVAIVGYTNAGKSTLFNRVTGAAVLAKDQVFATLDPTVREVRISPARKIILSDTVGFISDLPTMLVAAFRATLEEVIEADLILHVRDISHPESDAQAADVEQVLREIGIDARMAESRILEVWNKVDRLPPERRSVLENAARRRQPPAIMISAATGEGLPELLEAIDRRLSVDDELLTVTLAPQDGKLLAWLYANSEVVSRDSDAAGRTTLTVRIEPANRARLEHQLATGRTD